MNRKVVGGKIVKSKTQEQGRKCECGHFESQHSFAICKFGEKCFCLQFVPLKKVIINWEDKVINCVHCKKPIQCRCIEFEAEKGSYYFCSKICSSKFNDKHDAGFDFDFGQYDGHYYGCFLGGHYKEKWRELKRSSDVTMKLYLEFHAKWKALAHPKKEGET